MNLRNIINSLKKRPQGFASTVWGAALLLLLTGCRGQISERPPVHLNPNMDQQARLDPQEPMAFFSDGRAMRPLVKGTVPRPPHKVGDGDSIYLKADDHFYRGKKGDSYVTTLPKNVKVTKELLKIGQKKYNIFCAPCHGYNGDGKGVVTLFSKSLVPRNFHQIKFVPVGRLFEVITNGLNTMPPFKSQLTPEERWAVVAYIRALQLTRSPLTDGKKK